MKDRTPQHAEETLTDSNIPGASIDFQPGKVLDFVYDIALLAKELPHLGIGQSRLSQRREERAYQEEQARQGKSNSGWGADR